MMLHLPAPLSIEGLFSLARRENPSTILRAICLFATSREGYLVTNGYSVRGADDFPLIEQAVVDGSVHIVDVQDDIVLASIGLVLVRTQPVLQTAYTRSLVRIAVVTARLGLLAQALDMAFHHLEHRVSFGQKTMHHQLIKTRFAYANNLIVRLLDEICVTLERNELHQLAQMHPKISEEFAQVSKLMGGHGYLISGINALEYLSSLIASIYALSSIHTKFIGLPNCARTMTSNELGVAS